MAIVGHSDRLGYARCMACHEARGCISDHAIYAGDDGACEHCGASFNPPREVRTTALGVSGRTVTVEHAYGGTFTLSFGIKVF